MITYKSILFMPSLSQDQDRLHQLAPDSIVCHELGIYKRKNCKILKLAFFFDESLVEILVSWSLACFLSFFLNPTFVLVKKNVFFRFFLKLPFFVVESAKRVFVIVFLKSFFYKFPPLRLKSV